MSSVLGIPGVAEPYERIFDQDDWRYRDDSEIEWEEPAEVDDDAIVLFAPIRVQEEPLLSDKRFKLVRAGRRGSKSRFSLYAATVGHGPEIRTLDEKTGVYHTVPMFKGLLEGLPILWLAPDIPQAIAIWEEEILPRFEGKAGVRISKKHHVVQVGKGSLRIVSAENVDSIRGKKFAGAILDEAAHFDLEYAWHKVVRPALVDLRGWAIFPSTPNFGTDHPRNENRKHDQSYFNVLCHKHLKKELSDRWGQFHWTTHDNEKLDPEELHELVEDYKDKPDSYDQEILAKLLEGIEGTFFREFSQQVHVRKAVIPEYGVWWGGGMDWGYSSPGWFGLEAHWQGPYGRREHLKMEFSWVKLTPYQAGFNLGKALLPHPRPEFIVADSSMWDAGDGEGNVKAHTVAEKFQKGLDDACGRDSEGQSRAPVLVKAMKGPGSRETRALAMREVLKYTVTIPQEGKERPKGREVGAGVILPWHEPILSIEPGACPEFVRCMEILPTDPKKPELPATEGVFDHPYDGKTYLEVFRKAEPEERREAPINPDRSEGARKFKVRMERDDEHEGRRTRFIGRGARRGQ